jgi:hypothetical protein
MRELTGKLTNCNYYDTSRNGNSRYTADIGGAQVFTGVDSSLGYSIQNHEGKRVKVQARIIRGKLTIDSSVEVLPDDPDADTVAYRTGQFEQVRRGADKTYKPIMVISSDGGRTKHLNLSWEEFEKVAALLTGKD